MNGSRRLYIITVVGLGSDALESGITKSTAVALPVRSAVNQSRGKERSRIGLPGVWITAESTAALRSARSGGGCFVSRTKLCQAATDYSGAVAKLERAAELRPDFQETRSVLEKLD